MFVKECSEINTWEREEKKARASRKKSGLVTVADNPTGSSGGRMAFGIISSGAKMPGLYAHPLM